MDEYAQQLAISQAQKTWAALAPKKSFADAGENVASYELTKVSHAWGVNLGRRQAFWDWYCDSVLYNFAILEWPYVEIHL